MIDEHEVCVMCKGTGYDQMTARICQFCDGDGRLNVGPVSYNSTMNYGAMGLWDSHNELHRALMHDMGD